MTPSEELKDAWTIINILHMERMDDHEVWPRALEWLKRNEAHGPNAPEPQWHNPEDYPLTAEEKADGWRFLTAGEATVPADAMFKYNHAAGMTRWSWDDAIRYEQITYFTRTPLPK